MGRLSVSVMWIIMFLAMASAVLSAGPGVVLSPGKFDDYFKISLANDHVKVANGGQSVQLFLDQKSAAGFASKNKYLFGKVSMQLKLVPGDSAGTVTAYYMASDSANRDEIDFEFLGNTSGNPYILQTNIYANGVGNREQRIYLWFDPTTDFHSYSILWNKKQIVMYVDSTPIRVYKNNQDIGVPYLTSQPMGVYSSLWNADDWATRGGLVKTNWAHAPFIASYRNFNIDACAMSPSCVANSGKWWDQAAYQGLSEGEMNKLRWVQKNYMIYNYCTDTARFPRAPAECSRA